MKEQLAPELAQSFFLLLDQKSKLPGGVAELCRKIGVARCVFYRWRRQGRVSGITTRRASAICRRLGCRLAGLTPQESAKRGRPKFYIELASAGIRLEKAVGVTRGLSDRFLFELYAMLQREGLAPSISLNEKSPAENYVEVPTKAFPVRVTLAGRSGRLGRQLLGQDARDNSVLFQLDISGDVANAFLLAIKTLATNLENYQQRAKQDDARVGTFIRQTHQ